MGLIWGSFGCPCTIECFIPYIVYFTGALLLSEYMDTHHYNFSRDDDYMDDGGGTEQEVGKQKTPFKDFVRSIHFLEESSTKNAELPLVREYF